MKYCSKCKQTKQKSEFYNDKSRSDGFSCHCKSCSMIRNIKNEKANPQKYWASKTLGRHKRRGYEINITINELVSLANKTSNCKYCGCELIFDSRVKGISRPYSPTLDRINNENELNINNVQIICRECNTSKGTKTHIEFINYCRSVAVNHTGL